MFYLTEHRDMSDNDSLSNPCDNSSSLMCSSIYMVTAVIYPEKEKMSSELRNTLLAMQMCVGVTVLRYNCTSKFDAPVHYHILYTLGEE